MLNKQVSDSKSPRRPRLQRAMAPNLSSVTHYHMEPSRTRWISQNVTFQLNPAGPATQLISNFFVSYFYLLLVSHCGLTFVCLLLSWVLCFSTQCPVRYYLLFSLATPPQQTPPLPKPFYLSFSLISSSFCFLNRNSHSSKSLRSADPNSILPLPLATLPTLIFNFFPARLSND